MAVKTESEKVLEIGLVREDGYIYFIDIDGDISRIVLPGAKLPGAKRSKNKEKK